MIMSNKFEANEIERALHQYRACKSRRNSLHFWVPLLRIGMRPRIMRSNMTPACDVIM